MNPYIAILIIWTILSFWSIMHILKVEKQLEAYLAFTILLPGTIMMYILISIEEIIHFIKKLRK
jgi:hypothetical protein